MNSRDPFLQEQLRDEPAPEPRFAVGASVRVPKFEIGTVLRVAGDQVTIVFPHHGTRTFLVDYVEPA